MGPFWAAQLARMVEVDALVRITLAQDEIYRVNEGQI